jgi:hypothetical protein
MGATCKKAFIVDATTVLRVGMCELTNSSMPRGSAKAGASPEMSMKYASIPGSMGMAMRLCSCPLTRVSAVKYAYPISQARRSAKLLSPLAVSEKGKLSSLCTGAK